MPNLYALGSLTPDIAADCWIAPDARVIGQARLSEGVSIWWGAIIRADNEPIEIGYGSNLQEHVVCHVDPGFALHIGAHCTIGHKAMLHGCHIGDGSLIGMGATVLNGARIGKHCLIGAGALVPEGAVIPDASLVIGVPGRVKRPLTEAQVAALQRSAATYRHNKERFRTQLQALN